MLLADPRILVLDEPTEHLDEPTARAFVADLATAAGSRTVLVLTHRPDLFPADSSPLRHSGVLAIVRAAGGGSIR